MNDAPPRALLDANDQSEPDWDALLAECRAVTHEPPEVAAATFQRAMRLATLTASIDPAVAEILYECARHFFLQAQNDDMQRAAERALALARSYTNPPLLRKCLTAAGLAAHRRGRYEVALAHHEESLRLVIEIGEPGMEAPVWNNLGLCFDDLALTFRARDCYQRACEHSNSPKSGLTAAFRRHPRRSALRWREP